MLDLESAKKLIKKYAAGHEDYVNQCEVADRYYRNKTDILFKKHDMDEQGNPMRKADNRIPRNFHGLLVNQKAAYGFTIPPVLDVGTAEKNKKIRAVLGDEYTKNCMQMCINASNMNAAWVHCWRGDNGFEWAVVDSRQIIPIFDCSLKQKLIAVLRTYPSLEDDGERSIVYEYWTDKWCQAFRRKESDTIVEGLQYYYDAFINPETEEPIEEYQHDIGEVPFIPFWNNNIHTNDLWNIKHLIDVYDKVFSGFINDLDDVQELIFILTGYGGTDLNGFLQELKKYKVIKLDDEEGAGVSTLNIEIPIEARNSVLEATRKAIFEQGQGFDPQPENFGNQSGEALKFMYALIEMKVGLMETEFRLGFAKLVRAICNLENITCDVINQTWTRTRIKNDTELANICKDSVGVISKKTILKNHPFVEDVEEELKQLKKEEAETEGQQDTYQAAFEKEDQ